MTLLLLPWHSSSVNGITVSLKFSMIFLVRHLKYVKSFLYSCLIFEEFLVSFAILDFALCVLNFPPMVDFYIQVHFWKFKFYLPFNILSEDASFKKKITTLKFKCYTKLSLQHINTWLLATIIKLKLYNCNRASFFLFFFYLVLKPDLYLLLLL